MITTKGSPFDSWALLEGVLSQERRTLEDLQSLLQAGAALIGAAVATFTMSPGGEWAPGDDVWHIAAGHLVHPVSPSPDENPFLCWATASPGVRAGQLQHFAPDLAQSEGRRSRHATMIRRMSDAGLHEFCLAPTAVPGAPGVGLLMVAFPGNSEAAAQMVVTARIQAQVQLLAASLHAWRLKGLARSLSATASLTTDDIQLLRLARGGSTTKALARALNKSNRAVDSQWQRIKDRLECEGRQDAVRKAWVAGLLMAS